MAPKTVNFYRCVGMTTYTKVGARHGHTATGLTGMALNAGFQAVFPGANPATKGVVALVIEELRVVTPHESRVFQSFVAPGWLDDRLRHTTRCGMRCQCLRPNCRACRQQQDPSAQAAGNGESKCVQARHEASLPIPSGCSRWDRHRRKCGSQCTCCSRCQRSVPSWIWPWTP